ncbi:MAG: hypothetical protein JSV57_02295 [Candidatus Bathyarchaeota archaeon]|nr:MAG: hypothetical protein JSV57_02295 [Candidatus Bathyarchaeota archaeon]
METPITEKDRKELQRRLIKTFKVQISHLSAELQQILADDLITALQNRLTALAAIQARQTPQTPKTYLESINHLYTPQQKQG